MILHSPEFLWFYILLALAAVYLFMQKNKKHASVLFSQVKVFAGLGKSLRVRLLWLPTALKILSLALMIFALARPQKADTQVKKNIEGIDIMIALDISDSMLIEDMKPLNRLESAKETLRNFVGKRSNDRIGVIIFAGESFTLVPLTLDYKLILERVDEIKTAQEARVKDGTAIGVALANAAGKLKDSTAKSKVMIFMTDGENNSGTIDPDTGLEIAKGYGIKIYSIGIGKDGPTRIPVYQKDLYGNKVKTYQPFESTVNEDLLGRMGQETGGKYFRANKEDSLGGVFNEIDRLEKTKIDINKYVRYEEIFRTYLLPSLICYLLSLLLSYTWLRRRP